MDKRSASLAGWGQPHDALKAVAPDAAPVDYAREASVEDALSHIALQARNCELVIGWSLGGQMAARAIAAGLLKPKKLVLIAAPYQFVQTGGNALGMKRFLYDKFRSNMQRNPQRTLDKAWELVAMDDMHARRVREHMNGQDKTAALEKDWLGWLDRLDGFSCDALNFSRFPPTLIIHGDNDAVVEVGQAEHFAQSLPDARLLTFTGCGHAPHWHDPEAVKRAIKEHIDA